MRWHMITDTQALASIQWSDRAYFEAGAERMLVPGGVLAHMPGFEAVTAAGAAHLLDPAPAVADPAGWVATLGRQFAALGRGYARVYMPGAVPSVEEALRLAGYAPSPEIAFVARMDRFVSAPVRGFTLRKVRQGIDWQQKEALYCGTDALPDGKPGQPQDWNAFERRKAEAGYLQPFLVLQEGKVVATFSVAHAGRLLRLKNVLVHADHRRRGAGSATVALAFGLAVAAGCEGLGVLAVANSAGAQLYRRLGLDAVGRIEEYIRCV